MKDDNDLLREGSLTPDPFANCDPIASRDDSQSGGAIDLDTLRVGAFYDSAVARMQARADGTEKPILWPWDAVNAATGGGLWPGLSILVGNTGSGKSQFALQTAVTAADAGVPVMYAGLELSHVDLVARLLGFRCHSRWSEFYLGKDRRVATLAANHRESFGSLPFYLDVAPSFGWQPDRLNALATAMRRKHPEGPILLVVDFLQLVAGDEHSALRERIARAAYIGRSAAVQHDASVLLVSSTARENYAALNGGRENNRGPKLGEGNPARFVGLGKEAGEIEFAADAVLVLAREPWPENEPAPSTSTTWLAVAKLRAGAPAWVKLAFDGSQFIDPAWNTKTTRF